MKYIICCYILCVLILPAAAQPFITKGKIEFERKYNVHKAFEDDNEFTENIKTQIPQFSITYFDMIFDDSRSLYRFDQDNPANKPAFMDIAFENTVLTDFNTRKFSGSKKMYTESFLVQDSLVKFNWKITSETRKIAGFNCRRAETIIMDSVYVVAFYTDEILLPGGPESFNGLPGMILGIALPRLHLTMFATKVELIEPVESDFKLPATTKAKKTTLAGLQADLRQGDIWGKMRKIPDKYINRAIWFTTI